MWYTSSKLHAMREKGCSMRSWTILACTTWLTLAGCDSSSEPAITCATDISVGEVQPFAMPTPSRTEGITFDASGKLFVSSLPNEGDNQLLELATNDAWEVAAEAESILGLASHRTGIIAAGIETGELLLIDPATGVVDVLAADLGAPNFVVVTPWDTILVSDDTMGTSTIREVTFDGNVSVWVEGVPTPNGMVFSLDERTLYVAATFEDVGLWRVPVSADGKAGAPQKWVVFDDQTWPDGVAIDSEGNVYVALNGAGKIAQVTPDGTDSTIAEGLGNVASLAFGRGEFDHCSIYATDLFDTQLRRVGIGILGTER
jgi:gluconolactonase